MNTLRAIKSLIAAAASGTTLVVAAVVLALAVLVLFVIPGGVGILPLEWERGKRWLRRTSAFLLRTTPLLNHKIP